MVVGILFLKPNILIYFILQESSDDKLYIYEDIAWSCIGPK